MTIKLAYLLTIIFLIVIGAISYRIFFPVNADPASGISRKAYLESAPIEISDIAVSDSQVILHWQKPQSSVEISGYHIYRDGTEIGTTTGEKYALIGLEPMKSYSFSVVAQDALNNPIAKSILLTATTTATKADSVLQPIPTPGSIIDYSSLPVSETFLLSTPTPIPVSNSSPTSVVSLTPQATSVPKLTPTPKLNPTPKPASTPTPNPRPTPTATPTPTPTPTPLACGAGGACTAAQIASHNTSGNCWVYLSPLNKTYNVTGYLSMGYNSQRHPAGNSVIANLCGTNIYNYFVGSAGRHSHSSSALNTILQSYYIGPFQP